MSEYSKPRYARIGFTVVVGVVAIAATLIYIGGFGGKDMEVLVESYYDSPVSGLSVGSSVNFRGLKIGEVRDIMMVRPRSADFSVSEIQRIRMVLALDLRRMGHRVRPDEDEIVRMLESYVSHGLRATVSDRAFSHRAEHAARLPDRDITWLDTPLYGDSAGAFADRKLFRCGHEGDEPDKQDELRGRLEQRLVGRGIRISRDGQSRHAFGVAARRTRLDSGQRGRSGVAA